MVPVYATAYGALLLYLHLRREELADERRLRRGVVVSWIICMISLWICYEAYPKAWYLIVLGHLSLYYMCAAVALDKGDKRSRKTGLTSRMRTTRDRINDHR